jgi:TolB-like protein
LGLNKEAIAALETSLKQEPSGRAKHYLNLARKKDLDVSRTTPPSIRLDATAASRCTREKERGLRGEVNGEGWIAEVSVAGVRQFRELAERTVRFSRVVRLKPGTNVLEVAASDLADRRTAQRVEWVADWQPPVLTVLATEEQEKTWRLKARCQDDYGLESVAVGGDPVLRPPASGAGRVAQDLDVSLPKDRPTLLLARDMAGNELRIALSHSEPLGEATACAAELAALPGDGVTDGGVPFLTLALAETGPSGVGAPAATDRVKPSLRLGTAQTKVVVFQEEYFLDGRASDPGGLASVQVNGEDLLPADAARAVQYYFARRLSLDLGTNEFEIVARDVAGNRATQRLSVVRRKPEYLDAEFRLTLGITPVAAGTGDTRGQVIAQALQNEVLKPPARFHVLERDEGWDFILREQQLSQSDLADPRSALRIGKMLPAELLMMTTLRAGDRGVTVCAKIVETSDGRHLFSEDVYTEKPDEDLDYKVEGLAMKVKQRFPLAEGKVLGVDGKNVTISVGADDGIGPGAKFVVIHPGQIPPPMLSGSVRKRAERPVQLAVSRAGPNSGLAVVVPNEAGEDVKTGDFVYAR